jgi:hypothetical protein
MERPDSSSRSLTLLLHPLPTSLTPRHLTRPVPGQRSWRPLSVPLATSVPRGDLRPSVIHSPAKRACDGCQTQGAPQRGRRRVWYSLPRSGFLSWSGAEAPDSLPPPRRRSYPLLPSPSIPFLFPLSAKQTQPKCLSQRGLQGAAAPCTASPSCLLPLASCLLPLAFPIAHCPQKYQTNPLTPPLASVYSPYG